MKLVNFHLMNSGSQPEDLQILDVYYGYLQWKNKNNNYQLSQSNFNAFSNSIIAI